MEDSSEFPVKKRDEALRQRIDQMRRNDEWNLFQDFCCRCLSYLDYSGVLHSNVRNDYGRDAVATDRSGRPCFVAVSFAASWSKVLSDARRWTTDPNRDPAELMVFMTWEAPVETTVSTWAEALRKECRLRLVMVNGKTLIGTATSERCWPEICALLGIRKGLISEEEVLAFIASGGTKRLIRHDATDTDAVATVLGKLSETRRIARLYEFLASTYSGLDVMHGPDGPFPVRSRA